MHPETAPTEKKISIQAVSPHTAAQWAWVWSALEVVAGRRVVGRLRGVDHLDRLLKEI